MKAIAVDNDRLVWKDCADPELGVGAVEIAVKASAVNRADLMQRKGAYPPPPGASEILGLECAGEVTRVGEGVERCKPGDSVCALLSGGGYAEKVVVPAGQVLPVPAGLNYAEAASLPEVYATAYLNLYIEGELDREEKVILHAGGSGVGTAAIQLLAQSDNPCFVTVGNQSKLDSCVKLGAESGCIRHSGSFLESAQAWSGSNGVDMILDPVGAEYLASNIELLRQNGRLVFIGLMSGARAEINLAALLGKRLKLIGSTLRSRSISEKAQVMDALHNWVWPHLEDGRIKPIIEAVIQIENAQDAHDLVESNDTFGKVVLSVGV